MKKYLRMMVITIILVSITFLNLAFNSVNEVNYDFLRGSTIGSAFAQYDKQTFMVDVKLDEIDGFIDLIIKESDSNELVITTEMVTDPEEEYRYLYIYGHPKYNELFDFYMPYKVNEKPDFQKSFTLDDKQSALHKSFFLFDHNINIKSYDYLKTDKITFFYNFTVYGDKADIDKFASNISNSIDDLNLEYLGASNSKYSIIKYIYQQNRVSTILLWVSFLMMLYYVINLIIVYTEEITIRKLLGQSDLYITSALMKKISKVTIATVLSVCLIINLFFLRSLNFMLYGILLSELILLIIFSSVVFFCYLFMFLYIKRQEINQIIKSMRGFIMSFNFYQVVKTIILILMIYEIGPTIKYKLDDITKLNEINKYKNTMYKVSSFTGFKGAGELSTQKTYEKYMSDYYLKNNNENIHVYSLGYADSKDTKRSYAVFTFDYRTAKYYGYDYDEPTVIINEKVYDDINFEM
ncbi:MAG: hypothetical protein ACK5KQ_01970, partial [Anaerorhabdus sp.]